MSKISNWNESLNSHTGTETKARQIFDSSVEYWTMGESPIQLGFLGDESI